MNEQELNLACLKVDRSLAEHICLWRPAAEDWADRARALRRYHALMAQMENLK